MSSLLYKFRPYQKLDMLHQTSFITYCTSKLIYIDLDNYDDMDYKI